MQQQQRPSELELDDVWQRGVFDRLLAPVLTKHSYRNQIVFIPFADPIQPYCDFLCHIAEGEQ